MRDISILVIYHYDFYDTNATILSMLRMLRDMKVDFEFVHLLAPGAKPSENANFHGAPSSLFSLPPERFASWIEERFNGRSFDAIIAADPFGAAMSLPLLKERSLGFGYLSFEILPFDEIADEGDKELKDLELESLKHCDSALVQDAVRARILLKNTNLREDILSYCPVGPIDPPLRPSEDVFRIRDRYGIPRDASALLYSGSISPWACSEWLPEIAEMLPDDWFLVVCHRHASSTPVLERIAAKLEKFPRHIFLKKALPYAEYQEMVSACDAGLAFYRPDYMTWMKGVNLGEIGLASGKFTEYIHGSLCVITSKHSIFEQIEKETSIVKTIEAPSGLLPALDSLRKIKPRDRHAEAQKLFDHRLNPAPGLKEFLERLISSRKLRPPCALKGKELNASAASPVCHRHFGEEPFVRRIAGLCLDKWALEFRGRELAIFGAGFCTQWIMSRFRGHAFFENVFAIYDDAAKEPRAINGIPVLDTGGCPCAVCKAVLISTDAHQELFRARCAELFPNAEILDFFEGLPPGPYEKSI